ncbi:MAG: cupin domain-containing protein [Bacteroidetes bacterium]|nr:cupin domain-containing protein [Fibrella sp.]
MLKYPLHLHTKYSEVFYMKEGEFTFYIGSEVITLVPGESAFTPVNTPHRVVASDNP